MRPLISVAPGGKKYLEWALGRLRALTVLRHDVRLPTMTKQYRVAGSHIWIKSSEFGDVVRITGGGVLFGMVAGSLGSLPDSNLLRRFYVDQVERDMSLPFDAALTSPTPRRAPSVLLEATQRRFKPHNAGGGAGISRTFVNSTGDRWWGTDIHPDPANTLVFVSGGTAVRSLTTALAPSAWAEDDAQELLLQRSQALCAYFRGGAFLELSVLSGAATTDPIWLRTTNTDSGGNFMDLDCNNGSMVGFTDTTPNGVSVRRKPGFTILYAGGQHTSAPPNPSYVGFVRLDRIRSAAIERTWEGLPAVQQVHLDTGAFGVIDNLGQPGFENSAYRLVDLLDVSPGNGRTFTDARCFFTKFITTRAGTPFPGAAANALHTGEVWVDNVRIHQNPASGLGGTGTNIDILVAAELVGAPGALRFFFSSDSSEDGSHWHLYDRGAVHNDVETWFGDTLGAPTGTLQLITASGRYLSRRIDAGTTPPNIYEWDEVLQQYVFRCTAPVFISMPVTGGGAAQDQVDTDMFWGMESSVSILTRWRVQQDPDTLVFTLERDQYSPNQVVTESVTDTPDEVYGVAPFAANPHVYAIVGSGTPATTGIRVEPFATIPR